LSFGKERADALGIILSKVSFYEKMELASNPSRFVVFGPLWN